MISEIKGFSDTIDALNQQCLHYMNTVEFNNVLDDIVPRQSITDPVLETVAGIPEFTQNLPNSDSVNIDALEMDNYRVLSIDDKLDLIERIENQMKENSLTSHQR